MLLRYLFAALLLVFSVASVYASAIYTATLAGENEVPPVQTQASGVASFELDATQTRLDYRVDVSGLSDVIAAHLHLAPTGQNGGVVANVLASAVPGGVVNGPLATGTLEEADLVGTLTGAFSLFIDALNTGSLYVNVHTEAHPSGEIRGQVGPVSIAEPSSIALILLSVVVFLMLRRH
ncbi:CHRD domain-containing protein [Marinobacter sp. chi1]|uniref:CHRD domain-containing protein n=1 Tax=Marinobacter suaedae TaxID=3057675 RepID=A0ABT8VXC9_9GAMM|nr:CHRD domain-containing protein [Marinobacter sp. chi1]MDO3720611.1 CHRD domain-containing protein [Marinobacter sp. chi1]